MTLDLINKNREVKKLQTGFGTHRSKERIMKSWQDRIQYPIFLSVFLSSFPFFPIHLNFL